MNYKIRNTYEVTQTHEMSVDCGGLNYLVIYGRHINGGFIAIPNWGVSTEASDPTDIFYNTEKLSREFDDRETAETIAKAVKEHWESVEKEVPNAEESTAELSEEAEKDRFTAKECNFQGTPGYIVSQWHNGREIAESFVAKSGYKDYCEAIGVQPEIISGQEDKPQKPHRAAPSHEREDR